MSAAATWLVVTSEGVLLGRQGNGGVFFFQNGLKINAAQLKNGSFYGPTALNVG